LENLIAGEYKHETSEKTTLYDPSDGSSTN
jgi:hypothetical protein